MLNAKQLRALRNSTVPTEGNRIATAITLAATTQEEVADATGLTQSYISDVKRGRFTTITLANARKFADFFGCGIDDLFPARQAVA